MKVLFWGTRGNIPQPSYETLSLGGNTSCVQLFYDSPDYNKDGTVIQEADDNKFFIIDMGTGIIEFGKDKPFYNEYHIIICSFYWDYIQGLPFFLHIHRPDVKIHLYTPANKTLTSKNLNTLFDGTYSPLENINNLQAEILYEKIPTTGKNINGVKVYNYIVDPKHTVSAIKICYKKKKFVYAGNFEINLNHPELNKFIDFIKEADMFVCDAQHTEVQYLDNKGWGHSNIDNTIELGVRANVKRLLLFHHDPFNADRFLKGYLNHILKYRNDTNNIYIDFAKEGKNNIIEF
ncbi:MAG: hypothetical protein ACOCV8_01620 [Spirochaetota bacterium]